MPARQEILQTGGSPDYSSPIGLVPPAAREVLIRCPDFLYLLVSSNPLHSANTTSSSLSFPLHSVYLFPLVTPSPEIIPPKLGHYTIYTDTLPSLPMFPGEPRRGGMGGNHGDSHTLKHCHGRTRFTGRSDHATTMGSSPVSLNQSK